jgi:hypothetical protein
MSSAPSPTVIAQAARIVPANDECAPVPAVPVTCQKTWEAWAPLVSLTMLLSAVFRAALTWKMKTASGSPLPSRVRVPVRATAAAVL